MKRLGVFLACLVFFVCASAAWPADGPPGVTLSMSLRPIGTQKPTALDFTAIATDNVGVVRVELLLDGTVYATQTFPSPGLPSVTVVFVVDLKPLKRGAHTVLARSADAAGNVGPSLPLTFQK